MGISTSAALWEAWLALKHQRQIIRIQNNNRRHINLHANAIRGRAAGQQPTWAAEDDYERPLDIATPRWQRPRPGAALARRIRQCEPPGEPDVGTVPNGRSGQTTARPPRAMLDCSGRWRACAQQLDQKSALRHCAVVIHSQHRVPVECGPLSLQVVKAISREKPVAIPRR